MRKFLVYIIICLSLGNCCFAAEALILSDVIREAKEAQLRQAAEEKLNNLTPVKNNEKIPVQYEQNASEKINLNEITQQNQQN